MKELIEALRNNTGDVRKRTLITVGLVGGVLVLGVVLTKRVNALENVTLMLAETIDVDQLQQAFDAGVEAATHAAAEAADVVVKTASAVAK